MIGILPEHWVAARMSDVCQINPRGKSGLSEDDEVTFVPMAAVSEFSGSIVAPEVRPLREVSKGFTPFQEGDVLFAKITPCMENGKAAIARNLVNQRGYGSTEFHVFRPSAVVLAEWMFAIIRTPEFRRAAASSFQGAVGQQRVTASFLEGFRIPLPPISEQQRIVEILQEAEAIRQLRALAESKTAELIPAMFNAHFPTGIERASQPLHKVANVVSGVAVGRKTKGMTMEVPYLRVANVQAGFIDLTEVKTTPATESEIERFALKAGDILLTEGGDFDKLGRGGLWDGRVDPCIHQNHVFRVRPKLGELSSKFFKRGGKALFPEVRQENDQPSQHQSHTTQCPSRPLHFPCRARRF
jgi:type I restriction enzyme S subunit